MASGMVADFARMPTQRKVLVFVVIGTLLGLLYWKFAYKALDEDLEAAQAEHDNKVATTRRLAADIPAYEELRTHMNVLKELIEKNQTALPSAPELPAFFETMQHKSTESGVEIHKWTNRPEEPVETFVKVPVDIEITGSFMQIKRFFASLIQRDVRTGPGDDRAGTPERIVSIENLALVNNPEGKSRELAMTARFTAVTFRQEDKGAQGPPAPGQPAGARPVAPPVPAAPVAPPPPPLPSAGTPAGARARVENALEKGDAKDRNAAGAADPASAAPPAGARPGSGSDRLKGGL